MIIEKEHNGLIYHIAPGDTSTVCYLLFPLPPRPAELSWLESVPASHGISMVMISGLDWNSDMTPWAAPGIRRKEPFQGNGDLFLRRLEGECIPFAESLLGTHSPQCSAGTDLPSRILMGYSLSGLFAFWAAHWSASFSAFASVSGSLWFDGLEEWKAGSELSRSIVAAYFSVGDEEKLTSSPRLSCIEEKTRFFADKVSQECAHTRFELNPGTHFSPMPPRFQKALDYLAKVLGE